MMVEFGSLIFWQAIGRSAPKQDRSGQEEKKALVGFVVVLPLICQLSQKPLSFLRPAAKKFRAGTMMEDRAKDTPTNKHRFTLEETVRLLSFTERNFLTTLLTPFCRAAWEGRWRGILTSLALLKNQPLPSQSPAPKYKHQAFTSSARPAHKCKSLEFYVATSVAASAFSHNTWFVWKCFFTWRLGYTMTLQLGLDHSLEKTCVCCGTLPPSAGQQLVCWVLRAEPESTAQPPRIPRTSPPSPHCWGAARSENSGQLAEECCACPMASIERF